MRILNPALAEWLKQHNATVAELLKKGWRPSPINLRESLAGLTLSHIRTVPQIALVQDMYAGTAGYNVPCRIYHPHPNTALPVLVFFHGGGHLSGSVTVYDPICRRLALTTNHIVIAPEYRLAPECPFPAGITDGLRVVRNVWKMLDTYGIQYQHQLAIGGDSGGGAMCAVISNRAQFDPGLDVQKQFLLYPSVDYTLSQPSLKENASGYFLESAAIPWFFDQYFQHEEDRHAASPLFGEFTANLPATLMLTAEFCPLRDEGILYAKKAEAAGVKVQHGHFEDMTHVFLNLETIVPDACTKFYAAVAEFLNNN